MNFEAAILSKKIKRCRLSFTQNNHIEYVWLTIFYNSSYAPFNIGNYIIDTETFLNSQYNLQTFIPSSEQINEFEKSPAAESYYYLDRGYFFNKSFHSQNLKNKLSDCKLNDKMIKFQVMKYDSISVLGVVDKGKIRHFDYYSIDFSGIFYDKITLNEYVNNFLKGRKKQIYLLGFLAVFILIILFVFCKRYYFAIISFALMIVCTLNIKAYCLYYFPIGFKPLFATTLSILMSLLFFYSNRIPDLINILLLN